MKVIVQWENSNEIPFAKNLADILSRVAARLAAQGMVNDQGNVTMKFTSVQLPNLTVEAEPAQMPIRRATSKKPQPRKYVDMVDESQKVEPRKMKPPSDIRELDFDDIPVRAPEPGPDVAHQPETCRRKRYFTRHPVTGGGTWVHSDDSTICSITG